MDARAVIADVLDAHREVDGDKRGWMCLCTWSNPNIADEAYTTDQARAEFRQHVAQSALDALLQPTEQNCPTCGGTGTDPAEYRGDMDSIDSYPCPAGCSGGLVQRPPLVILASQLEQVGFTFGDEVWPNAHQELRALPIARHQSEQASVPVYRLGAVEGEQPDA